MNCVKFKRTPFFIEHIQATVSGYRPKIDFSEYHLLLISPGSNRQKGLVTLFIIKLYARINMLLLLFDMLFGYWIRDV